MKCQSPPVFRFAWPGKDEQFVCLIHAINLQRVANAIGLHLQFIRLELLEMGEKECYVEEKEGRDE